MLNDILVRAAPLEQGRALPCIEECILCRCRYCKFDTFHPAVDNGLPVTRVISRVLLQEKLAAAARRYGGDKSIQNDCHVVDFEEVLIFRLVYTCCSFAEELLRYVQTHVIVCFLGWLELHCWPLHHFLTQFPLTQCCSHMFCGCYSVRCGLSCSVPPQTVDESSGKKSVIAVLEDGRRIEGDLLIGADGIWSKVRLHAQS